MWPHRVCCPNRASSLCRFCPPHRIFCPLLTSPQNWSYIDACHPPFESFLFFSNPHPRLAAVKIFLGGQSAVDFVLFGSVSGPFPRYSAIRPNSYENGWSVENDSQYFLIFCAFARIFKFSTFYAVCRIKFPFHLSSINEQVLFAHRLWRLTNISVLSGGFHRRWR